MQQLDKVSRQLTRSSIELMANQGRELMRDLGERERMRVRDKEQGSG